MRGKERIYHSEGEDPGATVDFGAREDDDKTQAEIDNRNLGLMKEMPQGIGRQLIVKAGNIPLPAKLLGGALLLGGTAYASFKVARWLIRMTDKERFETKNKQNTPNAVDKF